MLLSWCFSLLLTHAVCLWETEREQGTWFMSDFKILGPQFSFSPTALIQRKQVWQLQHPCRVGEAGWRRGKRGRDSGVLTSQAGSLPAKSFNYRLPLQWEKAFCLGKLLQVAQLGLFPSRNCRKVKWGKHVLWIFMEVCRGKEIAT